MTESDFSHIDSLCEMIKQLRTENERYRMKLAELEDGWISVEDRLPEHEEGSPHYGLCSQAVLVAYGVQDKRIFIAEHRIDGWIDFHSNEIISRQELVTHWKPLPKPPTNEEEE